MSSASSSSEVAEESRPLLEGPAQAGPSGQGGSEEQSQPQQPVHRPKHSATRRQMLLGLVAALPSVPPGMSLGFSAIALEQLRLDVDDASWFASVTAMAFPLGSIIVGPVMDRWGRRPALLSINLVSLIGWLLLSVHTARPTMFKLIAGRLLTGVAGGLASVPASVYAAECLSPSSPAARTSLVTWSTVALSAGIFLVYALGAVLPYYAVASIATLLSIASFTLVSIFLAESPTWLLSKGRRGDAEWSQRELNLTPSSAPPEEPSEEQEGPADPPTETAPPDVTPPPATFRELLKSEAYKPLLIMIGFFFFQQFSGVYVVLAYMLNVVRMAGVVTVNPYGMAAIGGTVVLVAALTAALIYPSTGVRPVAALSGLGTAATMLFLGAFVEFKPFWVNTAELYFLNWIPFFVMLSNVAISTLGFLILPWSMLGEVFPLQVKGLAAGIATCLGFGFSFIATKLYPYILQGLGPGGVFFFFGTMALFGSLYVIVFLPETRGKTLEEIVESFSSTR